MCCNHWEACASAHMLAQLSNGKFSPPRCSWDSRNVLGSVTVSLFNIRRLNHKTHGKMWNSQSFKFSKESIFTQRGSEWWGRKKKMVGRMEEKKKIQIGGGKGRMWERCSFDSITSHSRHAGLSCRLLFSSSSFFFPPIPLTLHYIAVLLIPAAPRNWLLFHPTDT